MKKISTLAFSLFIFLSIPFFALSQSTWNVKIPYESADALSPVKKLIKTNDGGLLVLIQKVVQENFLKRKQYMLKYDADGQLLWEKEYDFGVSIPGNGVGPMPSRIIQLDNTDIIASGLYSEGGNLYCYISRHNTEGDSLSFSKSNTIDSTCVIPHFIINSEIYSIYYTPTDELYHLAKLNSVLEIQEEVILGNFGINNSIIDNDINVYLVKNSFQDTFRKFSSNGDLLYEKEYEDVGALLAISKDGYLTAYENALIQLNADLSEKWLIPAEDLLFFPNASSFKQTATVLLSTSDNGFILAGRFGNWSLPLSTHQIYIIKVDENGEWTWGYAYDPFYIPLNHIADLVEVDDGYVFVGTSEASEEIWLVKLNKEGLFTTSTEKVEKPLLSTIKTFPNPALDILNISFESPFSGSVSISNLQGVLVYRKFIDNAMTFPLDIVQLPSGIYIAQFEEESSNQIYHTKFIKM